MKREKPCRILPMALFFFALVAVPLSSQEYRDPATAIPLWRQALGGSVIGVPAAQAASVVVISDGGKLRCYGSAGRELWTYTAGGRLGPHLSRSREGTSYICRTNGTLIAVNRSGRELWRRSLGSPLASPVLVGWDGRIFVPLEEEIRCYTASGRLLWSRQLPQPPDSPLEKDGRGGLLVRLRDNSILRVNHFGQRASINPDKPAAAMLALPPGTLFGGASRNAPETGGMVPLLILYQDRTMEIRDSAGRSSPLPSLPAAPLAAVLSENGASAAIGMANGRITLLSLRERSFLWSGESHLGEGNPRPRDSNEIGMLYDERGIYMLSPSGACAFSEDGRRLWVITIRGGSSLPAFGDEGILYSGGGDWILYAYRLEERVRSLKQSLYGPAPEGSYGLGNPSPSSWADYYFRNDETELNAQLDLIGRAIGEGDLGSNEEEFTAYLMEIAGSQSRPPQNRAGTRPLVQVRHRAEALRLLSYMGSRETIPFLAGVFRRDSDQLVKAAAVEAIGRIGVDPEGAALSAFSQAISPAGGIRDEQVLSAVAGAIGSLCRFSGPPLSDAGIRLLVMLSSADRPPSVRNRAQQELLSLR